MIALAFEDAFLEMKGLIDALKEEFGASLSGTTALTGTDMSEGVVGALTVKTILSSTVAMDWDLIAERIDQHEPDYTINVYQDGVEIIFPL